MEIYDLIIIGAGPGGLSAALYAARASLNTLLIEKEVPGGKMINTLDIQNYPGFESVDGATLATIMKKQIKNFDIPLIYEEVVSINKENKLFRVKTNKSEYQSKTLILGLGTKENRLNIVSEDKYLGKGISYCATCDGAFYKNKDIVVYGGGDSAVKEGTLLASIAKSLTLIVRSKLRADKANIELLKEHSNVTIIEDTIIKDLEGTTNLEAVITLNKEGVEKKIKLDGLFVFIGSSPSTDFLKDLNILNSHGYILANIHQETSIEGLYAIGDCIEKDLRQIITASSDGANAVYHIQEYLKLKKAD
ncbi:MAG TPA: FAD-dependent oxidoreductase [Candidatus Onthovivens sp.]|nr:FAD-dependent oxidoreductase [Candidatus Onthovivens sp.]